MVAGHEERPALRAQVAERRYVVPQILDRPVHQVPRDDDDVRALRVHPLHDPGEPVPPEHRPDVQVRELNDAEP